MEEARNNRRVTIIGAGAAGCFLAQRLRDLCPKLSVVLYEKADKPLKKVAVTGGGRCNLTNSFALVDDLKWVYPRGHQLMKRLLRGWSHWDTMSWFEQRGIPLVTQDDECVFPVSQDAMDIVRTLQKGLDIRCNTRIHLADYLRERRQGDILVITTGGARDFSWLDALHLEIVPPIPSLFPLRLQPSGLESLMGIVIEDASVALTGTKFRASGPLLITHFGVSGPAILRLSSYAARHLHDCGYQASLCINWMGEYSEDDVRDQLLEQQQQHASRQVSFCRLFTERHWLFLLQRAGLRRDMRWNALNQKQINRLVTTLTSDTYEVTGRAPHKEEFVTAGGVALSNINPGTLECKNHPGIYFAGEVLDVDGITGGFNLQAAWSMANAIAQNLNHDDKL